MILDLIEKDSKITQRVMSDRLNVSVSMINQYLDEYEEEGFVKRRYITTKTVQYHITKKGLERKKVLNIGYLQASQLINSSAKENIILFLNQIILKGFKNIILYGAGEVAEIMLQVINTDKSIPLNAIAIIDDNPDKLNQYISGTLIIPLEKINSLKHDGILISSYTNNESIYRKLQKMNYPENKILRFFDL
jgi:FlaA1/EpsC-like NDP-sugar epimerase